MLEICTTKKYNLYSLWAVALTLSILFSLVIPLRTSYAAPANAKTCQARTFVDPLYPEFGDIVLVTRNLPQIVSTYQETGQEDSGVTHWHIGEAGLAWHEDENGATLQGEIVNNYNHEQRFVVSYAFINRFSWWQWLALDRTHTLKGWQVPFTDWSYWELDSGTLEGAGELSATIDISHWPTDFKTGIQVGKNTLPRIDGFSLSGFFGMAGEINGEAVDAASAYGELTMLLDCADTPQETPIATSTSGPTATPLPRGPSAIEEGDIVCRGESYVDSLFPQYGDIALSTINLPPSVSTYTESGSGTDTSHWNTHGAGLTWIDKGDTAILQGHIVNNYKRSQHFFVEFYFENRYNWTEWSALGRAYEPEEWDVPFESWEYWELKEGTLVGRGTVHGTLEVAPYPADYAVGFQIGDDTLMRNPGYGISGSYSVSGEINGVTVDPTESYGTVHMLLDCGPETVVPTPTETNTPVPTATFTPRPTQTPIPTATYTRQPTATETDTAIVTPTATATETLAPTDTPSATPMPTASPTDTATLMPTATATMTPTETGTPTDTPEPGATLTSIPLVRDTATPTETVTPTSTSTSVPTATPTHTLTESPTPTSTHTATDTVTPTRTPTPQPSPTPTSASLSLGNLVWLDENNNGLHEADESGVSNVVVRLLDGEGSAVIQTATTNPWGYYLFSNLPVGEYMIEIEPPVGLTSSTGGDSEPAPEPADSGKDGDDNGTVLDGIIRSGVILLEAGRQPQRELNELGFTDPARDADSNLTLDFGLVPTTGSIGDLVWEDRDEDGIQDSDEPTLANVTVNLWTDDTGNGQPDTKLSTMRTDESGLYRFVNLSTLHTYLIEFIADAERQQYLTRSNAEDNSLDEKDSDALVTGVMDQGLTAPITLESGQENLSIDAGFVPPAATPTPTATPTFTPAPTNTPVPTNTPGPTPTPTATVPPIAPPAAGDVGPIIRVDDYNVAPGTRVIVMMEAFNMPGLATTTVEVKYNPEVIKIVACNKDPHSVFDLVQCNPAFSSDTIRFNVTSLQGVSGDFRLAELTFEGLDGTVSESPITVELKTISNALGTTIQTVTRDGSVFVSSARSGDVNCSTDRNAVDAMMILQQEIGLRESTYSCAGEEPREEGAIYVQGCDSNTDGSCNSIDSLMVLQCDVGIANAVCEEGEALSRQTRSEGTEAVLIIDTVPTGAKERLTIPVVASITDGTLHAATVAVDYDPELLKPVGCVENPDKEFSMGMCNIQFDTDGVKPDTVLFNAVSTDGVDGEAKLVDLNFEVVGEVTENTALEMRTLTFADGVGSALPVTIENNEIEDIVSQLFIFLPIITQ